MNLKDLINQTDADAEVLVGYSDSGAWWGVERVEVVDGKIKLYLKHN